MQREADDGERAESEASALSIEAQALLTKVQRYKLECKLVKALLKVSLAVTSDVISGARSTPFALANIVSLDPIKGPRSPCK